MSKSIIVALDEYKQTKFEQVLDQLDPNLCMVKIGSVSFNSLGREAVIETANKFKGLDYRQQIIYRSKKLLIINDSKSTSFSSTVPLLESYKNIYWILGGLAKKGDKLKLKKKYFRNIKAFVYGKDRNFLINLLPNKISYESSSTLNKIIKILKNYIQKDNTRKVILFSPSAASFDQFKNFEDRGKFFNKIIKVIFEKIRI